MADALAAPLALGIAVGRIGDLIIGDHLGKPTSWLLAWRYSGGTVAPPFECLQEFCQAPLQGDRLQTLERPGSKLLDSTGAVIASGVGVHQTALYDMLLAWGLFALPRPGQADRQPDRRHGPDGPGRSETRCTLSVREDVHGRVRPARGQAAG